MKLKSLAVIVALAAGACAGPQLSDLPASSRDWLAGLEDGRTREEDVVARLGEPSERIGNGRTAIYHFAPHKKVGIHVEPNLFLWNYNYQLVLVYDADGVLRGHSIVDTRAVREGSGP